MTDGVANSTLAEHTLASLGRVLGAFAIACITAIPIGIMMGMSSFVRGVLDPIIEFYRPLPPLAYLPLIIIWLGIGEFPKVFLIFRDLCANGDRSELACARSQPNRSMPPMRWAHPGRR